MTSSKRMVAHSKRYSFQHVATAGNPAEAAHAGVACLWHDFCRKNRPKTSTIHPSKMTPRRGATVWMFFAGSDMLEAQQVPAHTLLLLRCSADSEIPAVCCCDRKCFEAYTKKQTSPYKVPCCNWHACNTTTRYSAVKALQRHKLCSM